jgi:Domain of unknown function (DUF6438)
MKFNDQQLGKVGTVVITALILTACNQAITISPLKPTKASILATASPQPTTPNFQSITLSRSDCYGKCPVYKLTVLANGKVQYVGSENVKVLGKAKSTLSKSQLEQLQEAINKVNYLSLKNQYHESDKDCGIWATDSSSANITIVFATNQKKNISHDLGCSDPRQLTLFEYEIDRIVNTAQWIGKQG